MQTPLESQYDVRMSGKSLLIYICNFHVLSHLLLRYMCKLHWNNSLPRPSPLTTAWALLKKLPGHLQETRHRQYSRWICWEFLSGAWLQPGVCEWHTNRRGHEETAHGRYSKGTYIYNLWYLFSHNLTINCHKLTQTCHNLTRKLSQLNPNLSQLTPEELPRVHRAQGPYGGMGGWGEAVAVYCRRCGGTCQSRGYHLPYSGIH